MPQQSDSLFVGVEIGGTKLQAAVGRADGSPFLAAERATVDPANGAAGILEQISSLVTRLLARYPAQAVGIGFGGPVDSVIVMPSAAMSNSPDATAANMPSQPTSTYTGVQIKSHQISGWENVPLGDWGRALWQLPVVLGNDCDVAALAEARFGAGAGARTVFYVTVGTGIGGGFVIEGKVFGGGRPAVAEIGHLRPGLQADRADDTVESLASGWGLAAAAVQRLSGEVAQPFDQLRRQVGSPNPAAVLRRLDDARQADEEYAADLLNRAGGNLEAITGKIVAQAAAEGNEVALEVLHHGCQALGWGIAQAVTLLAPEVVVIGGGVSLAGEQLFFTPLKQAIERYVFPPLRGSYEVLPAKLGEEVVVHGALLLAAELSAAGA